MDDKTIDEKTGARSSSNSGSRSGSRFNSRSRQKSDTAESSDRKKPTIPAIPFSKRRAEEVAQAHAEQRVKLTAEAKRDGFKLPADFRSYGSFDRRLIAASIDILVLVLISIPLNKILNFILLGGKSVSESLADAIQSLPETDTMRSSDIIGVMRDYGILGKILIMQFFSLALMWGYCVFSWMYMQATVGKYLMKLKIITPEGKNLSFLRCNLRILGYIPSTIVAFLGFFWIYFNKERRGWHDYVASTRVIHISKSDI